MSNNLWAIVAFACFAIGELDAMNRERGYYGVAWGAIRSRILGLLGRCYACRERVVGEGGRFEGALLCNDCFDSAERFMESVP